MAFRGGDAGGSLFHVQLGSKSGCVALFRNGEGAALDFQLFPGDAELFAGGDPVEIGRGHVRQQGGVSTTAICTWIPVIPFPVQYPVLIIWKTIPDSTQE
ncbi:MULTISPECIES: hypothetical protein [unclassified Akkermansia]|uniref:hypothetical protein n=1 Tax=unclassified Akkermansia TaxID=2608915 RepID=UPI001F00ABAA|nr:MULTISPECIES: hypothetical protein [unclassified Akkermansia]